MAEPRRGAEPGGLSSDQELEPAISAASSSGGEDSTDLPEPLSEYFLRHKVGGAAAAAASERRPALLARSPVASPLVPFLQLTKLDTLAGLAVRYNVTVRCLNAVAVCPVGARPSCVGFVVAAPLLTRWLCGICCLPYVQVSDIKRANGLLADTAMFAKDTLLIPTRPLPVGCAFWLVLHSCIQQRCSNWMVLVPSYVCG